MLVDRYVYHHERKDSKFSSSYCIGVQVYQMYEQYDEDGKQVVKDFISTNKQLASMGDVSARGVMAGIRDAAADRKSRNGRK